MVYTITCSKEWHSFGVSELEMYTIAASSFEYAFREIHATTLFWLHSLSVSISLTELRQHMLGRNKGFLQLSVMYNYFFFYYKRLRIFQLYYAFIWTTSRFLDCSMFHQPDHKSIYQKSQYLYLIAFPYFVGLWPQTSLHTNKKRMDNPNNCQGW